MDDFDRRLNSLKDAAVLSLTVEQEAAFWKGACETLLRQLGESETKTTARPIILKVVLQTENQRFALTNSLVEALWLKRHGWEFFDKLTQADDLWVASADALDALRFDPLLVEAVEQFEQVCSSECEPGHWESFVHIERRLLNGLRVKKVYIRFDLDNDNGKEHVRVTGGSY